jgi:O-antigen ligase
VTVLGQQHAQSLGVSQRAARRRARQNHPVLMLQVFAATIMVFPSDFVFKAIGGGGYVAALVAYFMFLTWLAATLFGFHNPLEHRSPVRIALCVLWISSLISYALIDRNALNSTQLTGADRWLLQLVDISGVILVASEFLRSIHDIRLVLRALVWGGAFCGIVAAMQYWLALDMTKYLLRILPGFSVNASAAVNAAVTSRGSLHRVVGTAIDPIELGVVAAMLLPLAIYLAMYDKDMSAFKRWLPVLCIALAVPTSVSRSAILAASVAVAVLVISLPAVRRLGVLAAIPAVVACVFVGAHGLLGTLKDYFFAGTGDSSIAHRVDNYTYVEQLVRLSPWFGQGGGTYIVTAAHILDNQFLTTCIELGLVGAAALVFFLAWPALAGLAARHRTGDEELRVLCGALAGAALAGAVCSATFDSFSFPMFVNVDALVLGLIGAAWLLTVHVESHTETMTVRDGARVGFKLTEE